MALFRLKACAKCGGDLTLDEGDWICLQCGSYYYVGLYRRTEPQLQQQPGQQWPRWRLTGEKTAIAEHKPAMRHRGRLAARLLSALLAHEIAIK